MATFTTLAGGYAVASFLAGLIIYLLATAFKNYRHLRQFKGPFLASISELWLFRVTLAGRMYLAMADAIEQYGSPVRVGPNMICTDDPQILRAMSSPRSNFRRGNWYAGMALDPRSDNILSERNEKRHNDLRAKLIAGYSGKDIPSLEADIDARIQDMINLITSYDGKVLDFARVAQYFTLDALTDIAFGYPFGYLTQDKDIYDYNKMTSAFLPVLELGCNHPTIHAILNSRIVQAIAAPTAKDKVGMGAVIGVAQKVVAERYDSHVEKQDMLGSFVSHGLNQQEAEAESLLQILAGADSTATAIRCTFLYILTSPSVYAKLKAEIVKTKTSFPIKSSEAKMMPYLQACIKEGLRMWPPLTGLQSKRAPPQGETINGIFIPGNVEVAYNPLMTQRRKDVFGNDAHIFRPERWFEADPSTKQKMERTVELVFGSGRYGCLGREIAFIELNKIFVELLRHFDWGIVDPISPMKTFCHGIHVQSDMFLRGWPKTTTTANGQTKV